MAEPEPDPMVVVAAEGDLPPARRVWGPGAWFPPEEREALDWLTLSRFLGWGVTVTRRTSSPLDRTLPGGSRWVMIACDPSHLGEDLVALLASRLAREAILVVARPDVPGGAFGRLAGAVQRPERLAGRALRWVGPGEARSWAARRTLDASALTLSEDTSVWVTLEGAPLIAARRVGRGVVATLGFHPSRARDADGVVTALLTHLLIWGSTVPVAWLDLEGCLVLRMDDPGGAQNVHLRSWWYRKLSEAGWAAVASLLRGRSARLSVGYVPGWVDDGDSTRGVLRLSGRLPDRVAGKIYPTPLVQYHDTGGHSPGTVHDYEAEFRGIQALRAAGLGDVELHGYSHMHPDPSAWAAAADRYEATAWYRELGTAGAPAIAARGPKEHPLPLGVAALEKYFHVRPTTLIAPGDEWTEDALERALDLGFDLVSNYHLAIRDRDRFCWSTYVCAPYLSEPGAAWFDAGLPVVGYFHDRDLALEGVAWLGRWLDRWGEAGARRLLDLRELAASVGRRLRLHEADGGPRLTVTGAGSPALVRPLPVSLRLPAGPLPSRLPVRLEARDLSLPVEPLAEGLGRVIIPCPPDGGDP